MISYRRSQRNTPSGWIRIGGHAFLTSYETVIAYSGNLGCCRLANTWGQTTGRHINDAGARNFKVVEPKELHQRQMDAIISTARDFVLHEVTK